MQSLKCQDHEKSIVGFCVNRECEMHRSCCLKCINEFHLEHPTEIIDFDDYNDWMKPTSSALSSISEQIKEIEYIVKVIKLSFENYSKCFAKESLTTRNLYHNIQTALKIQQEQNQLIQVISSLNEFSKNIFNLQFVCVRQEDLDTKGGQLIQSKNFDESLQYLHEQQSNDFEKTLENSLKTIRIYFARFYAKNVYNFSRETTSNHIDLPTFQKTLAIKTQEDSFTFAYGTPSISDQYRNSLKFKIIEFKAWISLGICQKMYQDRKIENFSQIGHGFYMISFNKTCCSWSNHDKFVNYQKVDNFRMKKGDIILMIIDNRTGLLTWNNETSKQSFSMKFQAVPDMYICACLHNIGESIELINCILQQP